jgi:thioesterase domain-containing protein
LCSPPCPLTPNGKVNRLALPPPGDEAREVSSATLTPRNRTELQLAAIWEQVLGVASIGVRDNFFDLADTRCWRCQIFRAVEQTFGARLPMSRLLQAPTIESFAEMLSQEINPRGGTLWWPFNRAARSPRSSCVPGVGGNVLVFARLARQLGPEQPFYGLQAAGSMARPRHSRAWRRWRLTISARSAPLRPKGPYLIGGTCTGGVVAYEIAQQLVAQGERVTLAIMESWHPRSYQVSRSAQSVLLWPILYSLRKAISYRQESRHLPLRERVSYWRRKLESAKNVLKPEGLQLDNSYYTDRVTSATFYAVSRYQPQPYSGRLLNIIAYARPLANSTQDTRLAWSELALRGSQTVYMSADDSGRLFVPPTRSGARTSLGRVFQSRISLTITRDHPCPPRGTAARIEPTERSPIQRAA